MQLDDVCMSVEVSVVMQLDDVCMSVEVSVVMKTVKGRML